LQDGGGAIQRPLVAVVDDDESVRESLPDLLGELGFGAGVFASAEEFLASGSVRQTQCLVLDIAMPGMTGLDLQRELQARGHGIPIVFITAQKDEIERKKEGPWDSSLNRSAIQLSLVHLMRRSLWIENPPRPEACGV